MARPLTTAHESVKIKTGALPLFNSSITARKAACNSSHQADLFLSLSISVVAFQMGCHPFALELPSTNLAALCLPIAVHKTLSC